MQLPLLDGGKAKIPTDDFSLAASTFTASMAKRTTTAPFLTAPIIQGKRDGTGVPDVLSILRGAQISGNWYANFDPYQGTIVFWITPEWAGNDGLFRYFYSSYACLVIRKYGNNLAIFPTGSVNYAQLDISAWTAGTTYCIVMRWDKNKLDGTNYACISVNDSHTFGDTVAPTGNTPYPATYIGSDGSVSPISSIIQGLTIYRRPLFDGTYGVDVGNGDELALIYAAGAGLDPTMVTGSWDVCFCMPTNGTAGALVTGAGEAWSHPHASNALTNGWLNDGYYGGGAWAVKFNGTSTKIDCGSDAGLDNLADAEFVAEGWFKVDPTANAFFLFDKGYSATGFHAYVSSTTLYAKVPCATTSATSSYTVAIGDMKWHHIGIYFNDAGDRKIYFAVDGKWVASYAAQVAGDGAIVSDAANNLLIGARAGSQTGLGSLGWFRISNNARYTVGTNFVPSRTPPAADANTLAQWNMTEGTGTTVDNIGSIGAAADGTITAGTWEAQWVSEGTPEINKSVEFNGTTTSIVVADAAELTDLQDATMTAEGYFRADTSGEGTIGNLIGKTASATEGWKMCYSGNNLTVVVYAATTAATATIAFVPDGKWHHWGFTFTDAGDRKVYLYKDRVLVHTSAAADGAVVTDAGNDLYVGNNSAGSATFDGAIGWVRISNVVRDIAAETNTRDNPPDPAVDANVVLQFAMNEGAGTTITDGSGEGNNGTLSNGTWNNTPDMATDSSGARIYNWGYVFGSGATHSGVAQTYAVTAGADYRLRALAYSEDGIGQPEVVVYDVTNAAAIVTVLGTVASTEQKPDVIETCFEIPAGCTSITVKLMNAIATGTVGWHKAVLLTNLWDDGGFETGTAVTDYGTPATSAQSNEQAHSGTYSWKIVTDGANEGFRRIITVVVGKYYLVSSWVYLGGVGTVKLSLANGVAQDGTNTFRTTTTVGSWVKLQLIARATTTSMSVYSFSGTVGLTFYTDDVMVRLLDDVSITATPATTANSAEGTGIRVDGYDTLTQPVVKLKATKGRIRFKWTPRYSAGNWSKFGNASTKYLFAANGSGANDLYVYCDSSNTVGISVRGVLGTFDATGLIVSGTTYLVELLYSTSKAWLKIDGAVKVTISISAFTEIPTVSSFGSFTLCQSDSVISPP